MDKIYKVILDGRQYGLLEKMLSSERAHQLARNQSVNGYELFWDMIEYICSPVTDGWCTYDVLLNELDEEQIGLLKVLTGQVFPNEEDYFVGQIGKEFHCNRDFSVLIELRF